MCRAIGHKGGDADHARRRLDVERPVTDRVAPSSEVKARLTEVRLTMRDAYVGEYAPVSI
ncbi:hypothetical protein P3T35_001531 [Kitasatospora sp. GP30]|uniref:hypothetical protein n=1 Tax=Kitasatospora sp. GP30 TaxID=3035084 RepID=UPI000C71035F|nr:hypothetical protein [Kitasatospora sp. GP30]MDH6139531.1 hypothetical protein [Kitasatospora sp. GP30]